jgi:hypothetical protein
MFRELVVAGLMLGAVLTAAGAATADETDPDPRDGDVHVHVEVGTPDTDDGIPGAKVVLTCSSSTNVTGSPSDRCSQDVAVDPQYCPNPTFCIT